MKKQKICRQLAVMLCVVGAALPVFAQDSDSDGMSDAYELFYGLNPTNATDAALNCDADSLTNLQESALMTDPYAADTDRDGFTDCADATPISRAYIQWGAPKFTSGDVYEYARPDWVIGSYRVDGEWSTNPVSWYVSGSVTQDVGALWVEIDRGVLTTNNVRYRVKYADHPDGELYLDLMDDEGEPVAQDVAGNLMGGTASTQEVVLNVPLATYTNAWALVLRRADGEVRVYEGLMYVDEDGDGLDREQEAQLGTSDYSWDSDGDGLSDWDEVFVYGTDPADADSDNDGMPDGWEVAHGLNPLSNDAAGDSDGDGVSNLDEYLQGRNPGAGAVSDSQQIVKLIVGTILE